MSFEVGDTTEVGAREAGPLAAREEHWSMRVTAALGGVVVVVCLMVLGSAWTSGLRPSTLDDLRSDIASGAVVQWYVASSVEREPRDFARAVQAGMSNGDTDSSGAEGGTGVAPEEFPNGGILVWRTWGGRGWSVAGPDGLASSSMSAEATEETVLLVRQLREAQVPMRPFSFSDTTPLEVVYAVGAVLLLGRLVLGPSTRVGTKWFWFWLVATTPLQIGAIAYAVTELVGLRRQPDRPLDRRAKGLVGFVGGIVIALAVALIAELLRSRGVGIPL
ncbi:hypothetical protein ACOCJ4_14490 [Knoellia sp. CPCC 206435]|uniref:hypothetical protein n=1 Tax=Knoellia terrae TaxID=3404797 RepID=UPI003B4345A3